MAVCEADVVTRRLDRDRWRGVRYDCEADQTPRAGLTAGTWLEGEIPVGVCDDRRAESPVGRRDERVTGSECLENDHLRARARRDRDAATRQSFDARWIAQRLRASTGVAWRCDDHFNPVEARCAATRRE